MIEVRDLTKRYGPTLAVDALSFDLRPGVRVPRSFHLFTIPSELVEVVPAYSGYLFFYYEDEIVIVDPVTWEIVVVIPA